MQLLELFERLKTKHSYSSHSGTIFRIFEIYRESQKNENGELPVFIKPKLEEKKFKINY